MAKLPLLGNHQRCWVRGRHAVVGVLRAGWVPHEVRLTDAADPAAAAEVADACAAAGVPVIPADGRALSRLAGGADHQGLAAKMPPFPYAEESILRPPHGPPPLVVLADGVQDPHNLGAILRSAAEFAADAVLLPARHAAGVTAGAVHSGAGAVGRVPVVRAADVPGVLRDMKAAGARVAAAVVSGEAAWAWDAGLRDTRPLVLAVGAEWRGVSGPVAALADARVRLPAGPVGSLNAAVAAGVLLYEATRGRE